MFLLLCEHFVNRTMRNTSFCWMDGERNKETDWRELTGLEFVEGSECSERLSWGEAPGTLPHTWSVHPLLAGIQCRTTVGKSGQIDENDQICMNETSLTFCLDQSMWVARISAPRLRGCLLVRSIAQSHTRQLRSKTALRSPKISFSSGEIAPRSLKFKRGSNSWHCTYMTCLLAFRNIIQTPSLNK